MTRVALALLLAYFVVASAGVAFAQKRQSVAAREKAAKKACAMGDFQKGADILTDLFVETDDPGWIYNQGRCYQQNNRWEQAISRFHEYLRKAENVTAKDRADTERQIADCEASLGKTTPAAMQPLPSPPPPIVTPPAQITYGTGAPAPAEVQRSVPSPSPSPSDDNRGKGLRVAGIATSSAGGAALLAGVLFNIKANGLATDIEKTNGYSSGKVNDRKTYETLGWIGYGAGAALVATGAVLYILGSRSASVPSVAVVPAFSPEYAGASVKGWF